MDISIIIPVYKNCRMLRICLKAIRRSNLQPYEICVIGDGGDFGASQICAQLGANFIACEKRGPAYCRNLGAKKAQGELLVFVDSDVLIRRESLSKLVELFKAQPEIDGAFGLYSKLSVYRGALSRYKNSAHRFFHREHHGCVDSFWAGFGAFRKSIFFTLGGFSEHYHKPSVEDIEFGYRATQSGATIFLDTHLEVRHMKAYSLLSLLKSDIVDRALPWTRLIHRYTNNKQLNLDSYSKVCAVMTLAFNLSLLCSGILPTSILVGLFAGCLASYTRILAFVFVETGISQTLMSIPFVWLYFSYSPLIYVSYRAILILQDTVGRFTRYATHLQPANRPMK